MLIFFVFKISNFNIFGAFRKNRSDACTKGDNLIFSRYIRCADFFVFKISYFNIFLRFSEKKSISVVSYI